MTRGGGTSEARRTAEAVAALLLLLAVTLRALLPPGYMPDAQAAAQGRFELILCSPEGLQTLLVDERGQPVGQDEKPRAERPGPCPFGLLSSLVFLPSPAQPVPPAPTVALAGAPSIEAPATAEPLRGPPLGARAPPNPRP